IGRPDPLQGARFFGWETTVVRLLLPHVRALPVCGAGPVWLFSVQPAPIDRAMFHGPCFTHLFSRFLGPSMSEIRELSDTQATWKRLAGRMDRQRRPASSLDAGATPIGNLGDLSLRGWRALARCDVIAAEDTRASRTLLDAWGVATPLMDAHRHTEASAAQ